MAFHSFQSGDKTGQNETSLYFPRAPRRGCVRRHPGKREGTKATMNVQQNLLRNQTESVKIAVRPLD
jgi:hypothetical protein